MVSGWKSSSEWKGFVDALNLYKDLVPYAPSGYMETNFRTGAEMFFQGKTAMAITESFAPILKAQFDVSPDFEYNLSSFPDKKISQENLKEQIS